MTEPPVNYEVIPGCREDGPEIVDFHHKVYPAIGWSVDYFNWIYHDNPAGEARHWVVRQEKELIGHFTAIPFNMKWDGEIKTGWRMQDLLTREDKRGIGLFHQLSRTMKQFLMTSPGAIGFTFPNQLSLRGFLATGWKSLFRLPHFEIDPNQLALPSVDLGWQEVSSFKSRLLDPSEQQNRRHSFILTRTAEYLNWRYPHCPRVEYKLFEHVSSAGLPNIWLVLKKYQDGSGSKTHICDWMFAEPSDDLARKLIEFAGKQALANKSSILSLWHAQQGELAKSLSTHGFQYSEEQDRWMVVLAQPQDHAGLEPAVHAQSWHLAMGDNDVY